jgi:hypothetical protein
MGKPHRRRGCFGVFTALTLFQLWLCSPAPGQVQGDDPIAVLNCQSMIYRRNVWEADYDATTKEFNVSAYVPARGGYVDVRLADPTCLPLTDGAGRQWFYLTGTSNDYSTRNFPIFRSRDLIAWEFVTTAFPDPGSGTTNSINGRQFGRFWSPQLYTDPREVPADEYHRMIYIAWGCEEFTGGTFSTSADNNSLMWASISKGDLLKGKYFADPATNDRWGASRYGEPRWYYYTVNNCYGQGCDAKRDGGLAQMQWEGAWHAIPSTHSRLYDFQLGWIEHLPFGYRHLLSSGPGYASHLGESVSTCMGDGPFIYFEPPSIGGYGGTIGSTDEDITPSYRCWMTFDIFPYYLDPTYGETFAGHHIAGYPMLDYPQFDARAAAANFIPLAYKWNAAHQLTVVRGCPTGNCCPISPLATYDGTVALCGVIWHPFFNNHSYDGGAAEGQAVFNRNGYTYVIYTRNTWDGPAYTVVYRKVFGSLYDARLPSWQEQTANEQILIAPNWVSNYQGVPQNGYNGPLDDASYGHPDVFKAWGNVYLVFHAKLPGSTVRHPYFKELTFDANGNIARIYDGYPGHPEWDLNLFATPNCEQP